MMLTPVVLKTGLHGAIGSAYRSTTNDLYFVEWGPGTISVLNLSTMSYTVLGTGYSQPEDIALSSDGKHAYVTERTGTLVRVNLASPNRASATVVSSGMTAPHQISLDEAHQVAFVVEYANPGRILRINLTNGAQTVIFGGLEWGVGLLVTQDGSFAYVTEQHAPTDGWLSRIALGTAQHQVLVNGLVAPFFLTWGDDSEGMIYTTERDPANRVTRFDLTQAPVGVLQLANVPFRPSSSALTASDRLVVCSDTEISRLDLAGAYFNPSGPMLLGIGHVPVTEISNGFATTQPSYFFYVVDAPFGGTLPLMINHDGAYAAGARYYRVRVGGVVQSNTWSDYKWNPVTKKFVLTSVAPWGLAKLYPIRLPTDLWYNHWLGNLIDTSGLPNGLHTIYLDLFATTNLASHMGTYSVNVQIDNTAPLAAIEKIFHHNQSLGWQEVPACAIVQTQFDEFTFQITAYDAEGHLKSWALTAWWGDNKAKSVASWQYAPVPSKLAYGISSQEVPPKATPWHAAVAGDPTSTRCAHTFYLEVWDRAIDGWNYIHANSYHKSITILL